MTALQQHAFSFNSAQRLHSVKNGSTPVGFTSSPIVNRGEKVGEGVKYQECETKNVSQNKLFLIR